MIGTGSNRVTASACAVLLTSGMLLTTTSFAVEPESTNEPSANDPVLARRMSVAGLAQDLAEGLEVRATKPDSPTAALVPRSILGWSNPTVGEVYGEIYLWTDRGRPTCLMSIYRWFEPNWGATLEGCSLSPSEQQVRQAGREVWRPQGADIRWRDLADVEPPVASRDGRLIQLRRLAREFSTTLWDTRRTTGEVSRQLRLMPQPLYRYPEPAGDAAWWDGALFTFVEGTDPEVLLWLEATPEPKPGFRVACVRLNSNRLAVTYEGRTIWTVEDLPFESLLNQRRAPYTLLTVDAETGKVAP
jgi:hypothetical protein